MTHPATSTDSTTADRERLAYLEAAYQRHAGKPGLHRITTHRIARELAHLRRRMQAEAQS